MEELEGIDDMQEGVTKIGAIRREVEILREALDVPGIDLPETSREILARLRELVEEIDRLNSFRLASYRRWMAEQGADPDLVLDGDKGTN